MARFRISTPQENQSLRGAWRSPPPAANKNSCLFVSPTGEEIVRRLGPAPLGTWVVFLNWAASADHIS